MKVKPKCEQWIDGVCYVAGQELPYTESKSDQKVEKKYSKKVDVIVEQKEGE